MVRLPISSDRMGRESESFFPAQQRHAVLAERALMIREEFNDEEQRLNLDLLQERREAAAIREARYKSKMEQYYNKKVRPAGFRPGEFVYRKNEASRVEDQGGSLDPSGKAPIQRLQKRSRTALTHMELSRAWKDGLTFCWDIIGRRSRIQLQESPGRSERGRPKPFPSFEGNRDIWQEACHTLQTSLTAWVNPSGCSQYKELAVTSSIFFQGQWGLIKSFKPEETSV
ncbi:hypothetical protein Tco_1319878 [Tanacetum coccineum]